MVRTYTSPPIDLGPQAAGRQFQRADIELEGVDHRGASFEARVFLNNPAANAATPTTPEQGYAGSFHVYGFGLPPEELRERDRAAGAGGRQGRPREAAGLPAGAAAAPGLGGGVRAPALPGGAAAAAVGGGGGGPPAAGAGEPGPETVPRTPARRYVIATEAVRRAAAQGDKVTVTVVPVISNPRPAPERGHPDVPLRIDRTAIVFYDQ